VFHLWLSVISHTAHRLTCPWCCTCSRRMAWTASSLCGTGCDGESETCRAKQWLRGIIAHSPSTLQKKIHVHMRIQGIPNLITW
jgi:hypothetical protein